MVYLSGAFCVYGLVKLQIEAWCLSSVRKGAERLFGLVTTEAELRDDDIDWLVGPTWDWIPWTKIEPEIPTHRIVEDQDWNNHR